MFNSTSHMLGFVNNDAPNIIDLNQPVSDAVEICYSNAFALIKLRDQKASGVSKVPRGVFRCILEYCAPAAAKRVTERDNPSFHT